MANTLVSNISHIIWRADRLAHVWEWHRNPDDSHSATCLGCGIRRAENSAMNPPCRGRMRGAEWLNLICRYIED